jgi:hypothetical protein
MRARTRKITLNVSADALDSALKITGRGITETVIAGLVELQLKAKRSALRQLKGKVHFDLDLDATRR